MGAVKTVMAGKIHLSPMQNQETSPRSSRTAHRALSPQTYLNGSNIKGERGGADLQEKWGAAIQGGI